MLTFLQRIFYNTLFDYEIQEEKIIVFESNRESVLIEQYVFSLVLCNRKRSSYVTSTCTFEGFIHVLLSF